MLSGQVEALDSRESTLPTLLDLSRSDVSRSRLSSVVLCSENIIGTAAFGDTMVAAAALFTCFCGRGGVISGDDAVDSEGETAFTSMSARPDTPQRAGQKVWGLSGVGCGEKVKT